MLIGAVFISGRRKEQVRLDLYVARLGDRPSTLQAGIAYLALFTKGAD